MTKSSRHPRRTSAAAALSAAALMAASGVTTTASAEPVRYRAAVVTKVRLGLKTYDQAYLKLTFVGDTGDVAPVLDNTGKPVVSHCNNTNASPPDLTPYFFYIPTGSASFSFQKGGKTVSGSFLPGQIFIALDTCSGGIGFGSFTGQFGFEPVYPLGLTHGSANVFATSASPLSTPGNMSGNAWSCIGFPPDQSECTSPDTFPLHTSLGQDFFVYMPYIFNCGYGDPIEICLQKSGSMNRGTFSVTPEFSE